jgi:parvulin-like peptidyl-prolyl cis-trans isomerase-like protein
MRKGSLVWFFFFSFFLSQAWGQGKPAAPPPTKAPSVDPDDDDKPVPPPPGAESIAMDAPVMTIKGLCPKDPSKPAELSGRDCKTVITRADFEKVARAIQPSLSPVVKKQLLNTYPRLLIMSREAEAQGLDKEEYFQQMFEYARMQILTQQFTRRIQDDAAKVPEQSISEYYQKNPEPFREYTLEKIYIPRMKQSPPPAERLSPEAEAEREKNAELDMTKLAELIRARAAAGEDFEALQKQAYQSAGLKTNPPNASMGKIRKTGLPPGHDSAFALKPGEVSQVISDAGGHYIYKMVSTDMETLAEAHDEIRNLLKGKKIHETMEKIQGPFTTETNEVYFGTGSGGYVPAGHAGTGQN